MMRRVLLSAFWVLLCASCVLFPIAFGQTRLEFEVASIRPVSGQIANVVNAGLHIDGSQARLTYLSLQDYIGMAYRVKNYQILGPDWLASERFDIAGKLPDGGKPEQIPEMLQTLLTDRFQIKMHRDMREFPVYALEIAKGGLNMKEVAVDSAADANDGGAVNIAASGSGLGVGINLGKGSFFSLGNNKLEGKKLPMAMFADMLTRFMDRSVVDATQLKGSYDFVLDLSPEDYTAMLIRSAVGAGVVLPPQALRILDFASGDSLSNGLQKAGLKLESRKAPLEVLVIDSAQKTPTEN